MALRVVNSSGSRTPLRVTNNYGMQGSTYNPQRTASHNQVQPARYTPYRTYNPQPAVRYNYYQPASSNGWYSARQQQLRVVQARQRAQWLAREKARIRREAAERRRRLEILRKRRVRDLRLKDIRKRGKGWKDGLLGALGRFKDNRAAREQAAKFMEENQRYWYGDLEEKFKQFETDAAARKAQLLKLLNNNDPRSQALVGQYDAWVKQNNKFFEREVAEYNQTQKELAQYAGSPIGGRAAGFFNTVTGAVNKVAETAGKAFNVVSWVASQPKRALNTALNVNTPDRVRQYHGGVSVQNSTKGKNFLQSVRNAYNATRDQRTIAFSKDQEAKLMAASKQSGFLGALNRGSAKYADDIADLIADPINLIGGGLFIKGSKLFKRTRTKAGDFVVKQMGKSKLGRNFAISTAARRAAYNPNGRLKWINRTEGSRRDSFFADNRSNIKQRKFFSDTLRTKSDEWKAKKSELWNPAVAAKLQSLDDTQASILQRYVLGFRPTSSKSVRTTKPVYSWTDVDLPRGFNKQKKREIEDIARFLKQHTDTLHSKNLKYAEDLGDTKRLKNVRKAWNRAYIPQFSSRGGAKDGSGVPSWWLKRKEKQSIQTAQQLFNSFKSRSVGQGLAETPEGRWIIENASDYKGEIKKLDKTLNVRAQDYKGTRLGRADEMLQSKRGFTPASIWKKGVLKYNPAWYVNNTLWNIPAAISAGGAKTVPEMVKLIGSKKYRKENIENFKKAASAIEKDFGKAKLAKLIEDIPRTAAFNANRKRGFSDDDALKRVNDWLFDYNVKNWERPLRSVVPFYPWNKGLVKLAGKMPFKYPRQAGVYGKVYDQFYRRPYEALPDGEQRYTTDEGETEVYNPKEKYKGKLNVGGKWLNTPFNPMNPKGLSQINQHPFLTIGQELYSSRDRFGNKNTDKSIVDVVGGTTPQYNLVRQFYRRNMPRFKRWFSPSGYSKEQQGQDPSKSNYSPALDENSKWVKQWKSFLGIPSVLTRNAGEEGRNMKISQFNTDYFARDWDKRLEQLKAKDPDTAYDKLSAEKDALAKKYGLNFEKDILQGSWSKYDTERSKTTKSLKQAAHAYEQKYWKEFSNLPKPFQYQGSNGKTYWSKSTSKPFWLKKYKEMEKNNVMGKNPYIDFPYYKERKDSAGNITKDGSGTPTGKRDYILPIELGSLATGGNSNYKSFDKSSYRSGYDRFGNYYRGKSSAVQYKGKWFKSTASRDRYIRYERYLAKDWAFFGKGKSKAVQYQGKWFKSPATRDAYREMLLWRKYYSLTDDVAKKAFIAANPQLNRYKTPTTPEEWNELRALLRAKTRKRSAQLPNFARNRAKVLARINERVSRGIPSNTPEIARWK